MVGYRSLPVLFGEFRDTKGVLAKRSENTKSDSVRIETPTKNHITDSQSAERESRLLPSNVLAAEYTATPLGFYLQDQLMVFSVSLFKKTHAKKQYRSSLTISNLRYVISKL